MIYEKMNQLRYLYSDFSTDKSASLLAHIKENIHAEKYITTETVQKCIDVHKRGKQLALGKFVDEDRIIACLVIDRFLSLDICSNWYFSYSRTYASHLNEFMNMLTKYYTPTIVKYLDDLVDYQKELDIYDPIISYKKDKYLIKVNYESYGEKYNSIIGVDKLTKENLKKVKLVIDDAEIFLINLKAFKGEIERFASNVVKFLGNDYEVKTSDGNYTITLSEDARRQFELNKRPCFYIYFIFNTNFLGEAAVSLRSYTISARVRRPGCFGSDIAIILERTVRMCDFDSLYDINFCDLDELYSAIRRTYENNFRCIEILD